MTALKILVLKGTQPYEPILHLQHRLASARHSGALKTDVILLLQHEPVFTLGHNGGRENLNVPEAFLRERGIQVVQAERGGNITYHGPGQIIAYPIINLRARRLRVTEYVWRLEEVMIQTAATHGVTACRNLRNHGVWVDEKKLGSVGIAVRHGITYHGLALNVTLSLEPFTWISPCGLEGVAMTSLREAGAKNITFEDAVKTMTRHLKEVFGATAEPQTIDTAHPLLQTLQSS